MTKQKVGSGIFWIAVIWTILRVVVVTIIRRPSLAYLTMDELNQTIWVLTGPLGLLYAFSTPLGVLAMGIGILIYSGAKGSTVWKFGIGMFLAIVIGMAMATVLLWHFPPLFGIGGTLILLSFIGMLWLWAKERMALKGSSTTAADFKLVGYVSIFIAAFFACGVAGFRESP